MGRGVGRRRRWIPGTAPSRCWRATDEDGCAAPADSPAFQVRPPWRDSNPQQPIRSAVLPVELHGVGAGRRNRTGVERLGRPTPDPSARPAKTKPPAFARGLCVTLTRKLLRRCAPVNTPLCRNRDPDHHASNVRHSDVVHLQVGRLGHRPKPRCRQQQVGRLEPLDLSPPEPAVVRAQDAR